MSEPAAPPLAKVTYLERVALNHDVRRSCNCFSSLCLSPVTVILSNIEGAFDAVN